MEKGGVGGVCYQFVFIPAWDSPLHRSISHPPHPSTGDKLATALQPPFNGGRCPDNVALSRAGSGLRCCICVFTVIGRKVGGGSGGGGMVGIVVH